MKELGYSSVLDQPQGPHIVYVEQPLCCCGLGNFVGAVIGIAVTIVMIPSLYLIDRYSAWKSAKKIEKQSQNSVQLTAT
jgi:hypothetical protein